MQFDYQDGGLVLAVEELSRNLMTEESISDFENMILLSEERDKMVEILNLEGMLLDVENMMDVFWRNYESCHSKYVEKMGKKTAKVLDWKVRKFAKVGMMIANSFKDFISAAKALQIYTEEFCEKDLKFLELKKVTHTMDRKLESLLDYSWFDAQRLMDDINFLERGAINFIDHFVRELESISDSWEGFKYYQIEIAKILRESIESMEEIGELKKIEGYIYDLNGKNLPKSEEVCEKNYSDGVLVEEDTIDADYSLYHMLDHLEEIKVGVAYICPCLGNIQLLFQKTRNVGDVFNREVGIFIKCTRTYIDACLEFIELAVQIENDIVNYFFEVENVDSSLGKKMGGDEF